MKPPRSFEPAPSPEGSAEIHPLFQLLRRLDKEKLWYRLERTMPEAVLVMVTAAGARLEFQVFESGEIWISSFIGDEDVEVGQTTLDHIFETYGSASEP